MVKLRALPVVLFTLALLGADAAAEEAPPRLYLHTGLGVGYTHYWQIGGADRDVGGATIDIPISLGARLRRWLAIGGAAGLQIYPAHSGTNNVSGMAIGPSVGAGGYFGLSLALLAERLVHGEIVVGIGGAGSGKLWGGVGLWVLPRVTFDVWSRGHSYLGIDVRAIFGQWGFPDNSAVRPFVGVVAGLGYTVH
jgi:hypothetical protein